MVTVAALPATAVTAGVMPVGAVVAVVPAALVYHATVPAVPAATFVVVAAKEAVPALPLEMLPDWEARLTFGEGGSEAGLGHPARNARHRTHTIAAAAFDIAERDFRMFSPAMKLG
jgi:hypothetical protein